MEDAILEPSTCPTCKQEIPSPADGRWRYAKGGKVHESIERAEQLVDKLNLESPTFEFRAVHDDQGRPRIVSRRKTA